MNQPAIKHPSLAGALPTRRRRDLGQPNSCSIEDLNVSCDKRENQHTQMHLEGFSCCSIFFRNQPRDELRQPFATIISTFLEATTWNRGGRAWN